METNPGSPEQQPIIPLRDFFRNPEGASYQVSPGGDYISWMAPWESRLNVFVQPVDGSGEPQRLTDATERDLAGYFWAAKDQIVYLQDDGGDENFHLYAVDADGANRRDLTPFPGVRVGVVDDLRDDEDHLLISMNQRDARVFDVLRLNTRNGTMEMVAENPGSVSSWITDHDGQVRAAVQTDGVNTELLTRATPDEPFRKVISTNFRESADPLFFTYDNKDLYASSNIGRDKAAIVRLDPATGKSWKSSSNIPKWTSAVWSARTSARCSLPRLSPATSRNTISSMIGVATCRPSWRKSSPVRRLCSARPIARRTNSSSGPTVIARAGRFTTMTATRRSSASWPRCRLGSMRGSSPRWSRCAFRRATVSSCPPISPYLPESKRRICPPCCSCMGTVGA